MKAKSNALIDKNIMRNVIATFYLGCQRSHLNELFRSNCSKKNFERL